MCRGPVSGHMQAEDDGCRGSGGHASGAVGERKIQKTHVSVFLFLVWVWIQQILSDTAVKVQIAAKVDIERVMIRLNC